MNAQDLLAKMIKDKTALFFLYFNSESIKDMKFEPYLSPNEDLFSVHITIIPGIITAPREINWYETYNLRNGQLNGEASASMYEFKGDRKVNISGNYTDGTLHGNVKMKITDNPYRYQGSAEETYQYNHGILRHFTSFAYTPYQQPDFPDRIKTNNVSQSYGLMTEQEYDENGALQIERCYDILFNRSKLDECKKILTTLKIKKQNSDNAYHIKSFAYDATWGREYLCEEYDIINEEKEGTLTRYNHYGKVIEEEEYKNDQKIKSTEYDPQTGWVTRSYEHCNNVKHGRFINVKHGRFIEYDKNGSYTEGQYIEDCLEGDVFHRTQQGILIKVSSWKSNQKIKEVSALEYYKSRGQT